MSRRPTTPESPETTHVDHHLDRATFLRRGATGGLVLVVGGVALAAAACGDDDTAASTSAAATTTAPGMVDDVAIAKLAATAELLAIDFYGMSIDTGIFKADDLAYLSAARQNEQDHYDALAKVLGAQAPRNLTFTYPMGTFDSDKSIADTGTALETAFVGAYMGAIPALKDDGLKEVAAQIGANEAQHLTTFKSLAAGGALVPNPAFPNALTAAEATAAVTPFLG
jgi:rubrerythrin